MHRRVILVAAAASLATPAFSQSDPNALTDADQRQVRRTLAIGSLALATSRLPQLRSSNPGVRQFAGFEVAEQETVADVLQSMQRPGALTGTPQPPTEVELERNLDDQGRAILAKLRAIHAGSAFDREYVKDQTEGHKHLLQIQEEYVSSGRNPELLAVAKLARTMIREHLTLLGDLSRRLG